MQVTKTDKENNVESSVLDALNYFDIFKHPLYFEEIKKFLGESVTNRELNAILSSMVSLCKIYVHSDLYMLHDDSSIADKRIKGSNKAAELISFARKPAGIISFFPFVKSICISGSLSKGYANEKSDIDFFIITQKNRLWICRSLLHVYKKFTFLNNSQHAYCMNYFIDESRLEIEEKNKFTATELTTLIPVYNIDTYQTLLKENIGWLKHVYPNFKVNVDNSLELRKTIFQKIPELIINIFFPQVVNKGLMMLTDTWWRYKWRKKHYPMEDYDLAMKTRWYVSKNHPANFQKRVLKQIYQQVTA